MSFVSFTVEVTAQTQQRNDHGGAYVTWYRVHVNDSAPRWVTSYQLVSTFPMYGNIQLGGVPVWHDFHRQTVSTPPALPKLPYASSLPPLPSLADLNTPVARSQSTPPTPIPQRRNSLNRRYPTPIHMECLDNIYDDSDQIIDVIGDSPVKTSPPSIQPAITLPAKRKLDMDEVAEYETNIIPDSDTDSEVRAFTRSRRESYISDEEVTSHRLGYRTARMNAKGPVTITQGV